MIDAHVHIWQIARPDHAWPGPDLPAIYRDVLPADVIHATAGIDGVVLVQAQPSENETPWLLEQAAVTSLIRAVVGWTDMTAKDAPERITALARHPKLRGLRPMLQGLEDDAWILRKDVEPALEAMMTHGLSFDALVFTRHLPHIAELARRWPELAIVIDHGAKPPIATPSEAPAWRDAITAIGRYPHMMCKVSGLITEAAEGDDFSAVKPYADHLLDVFGPERLIWGSDWPVLMLRDSWRSWLNWTQAWLATRPAGERDLILGGNAKRFYAFDRIPA